MDTVGILGGTFDPVHLGHLSMAEAVQRQTGIVRIRLIPDGDPPHKDGLTRARDRLNMVRLAVEGRFGLEASDMEVKRAGVTYTVDTLSQLREQEPERDFFYIVGSDTLLVIETWHAFEKVAALLAGLMVVPRPGDDRAVIEREARRVGQKYALRVRVLDGCVSRISATEVRRRAARHQPLSGYVPESVERYIRKHRLYRDPMLENLRATMTPARYRHTLGVEETAVNLALQHGVDPEKARLAALLHDCAKHMPVAEMAQMVRDAGVKTAPGEEESRALLHAAAGMVLARTKFGVTDEDVLGAIRWHTTGRAGMARLDEIIYLADMIEPGRRTFAGLDAIREAAREDLSKAMVIAARRTVDYVRSRGMPLNERTLELLNSIETQSGQKERTQ